MAQLFSRSADTLFRTFLVSSLVLLVLVVLAMLTIARSADITNQNVTVGQTVPFSHQHHVGDVGLDCRYCHQTVETSAIAGVPATQVCMNCHRELWTQSEMLKPVRDSWANNEPLIWNRVHDLPDYVYFNHSIHVHKGIGCYECHGEVGKMSLTRQAAPLTMQWCLDCHRNPTPHVRPRSLVFQAKALKDLTETPEYREAVQAISSDSSTSKSEEMAKLRDQLAKDYKLHSRTDCYTCHR